MTQLGEGVAVGVVTEVEVAKSDEPKKKDKCKRIYLHAFRGDRSRDAMDAFDAKLEDGRTGEGPGPSGVECLLYTGHVGISFEADSPIYAFNPDTGAEPSWQVIENLKKNQASSKPYPGAVTDDTAVFSAAKARGLSVAKLEIVYPESKFNEIKQRFDAEKGKSDYHYSFPGRGGDCNCATWPRKLGVFIPEGSGVMKAYVEALGKTESPHKMGVCEE
jgi:hypothetical protein